MYWVLGFNTNGTVKVGYRTIIVSPLCLACTLQAESSYRRFWTGDGLQESLCIIFCDSTYNSREHCFQLSRILARFNTTARALSIALAFSI